MVARIRKIQEDRKYYMIDCQDETLAGFRFYLTKKMNSQSKKTNRNKMEHFNKKNITDVDSLEFEPK